MSLTPPPPVTRRDWTLPIIAGVLAIVVVLAVCLVGSATAFMSLRRPSGPLDASLVPEPPVTPTRPNAKSGPECLIGDWLETSYVTTVEIGGVPVRLSGHGTLSRFAADGTLTQLVQNVVVSGSADGSTYEVVHNGSLLVHYKVDGTTISYSDPVTQGTTTLKINGVVRATQEIEASLESETYACQGNQLRFQGKESVAEWRRSNASGVPI